MADPYYTPVEIRALVPPVRDEGKYSDALIEALVAEFEELAERARGVAYRHREATATLHPRGWCRLLLGHVVIEELTSVTVDDVAWTTEQVDGIEVDSAVGSISAHWSGRTVVVEYVHGYEVPPAAILRACREFVRGRAIESQGNAPRNAISWQDDSGFSYRDGTADWSAGRYTGLRVVDDAINTVTDYRVPGVA